MKYPSGTLGATVSRTTCFHLLLPRPCSLGIENQVEISNLVPILHPERWQPILAEYFLWGGASSVAFQGCFQHSKRPTASGWYSLWYNQWTPRHSTPSSPIHTHTHTHISQQTQSLVLMLHCIWFHTCGSRTQLVTLNIYTKLTSKND